jgi:hypothetical protein
LTITYAMLAAAANEADAQGGDIAFRVESVTSGTLTKSGQAVQPGLTLLAPQEQWVWTPAANVNGTVAAFKVKAVDDTTLASSTDVQVSVAVSAVNDAPKGAVSISGTAKLGQVLTASNTLTDAEGIPTTGDGAIKYQWLANGNYIAGATASTYTLTQAEVGKLITAMASYTDLGGKLESVRSDATDAIAPADTVVPKPTFWKNAAKVPTEVNKTAAVDLSDAIAVLKMIVGLPVNTNNVALSPYQAIAADFDQNGSVELSDAIGVLKMVVGLSAPAPAWKYFDGDKLGVDYQVATALSHKNWSTASALPSLDNVAAAVKIVGVLTGDVDGSWSAP